MKYYIPKYHLEKLEKLVKALQKKTNVTFEVFENDTKVEEFVDYSQPDQPVYRYLTIAVELEINYKVGDYELVAELEHTGAGNIIRQINKDIQVPTTYRNVPCRCEHCNTLRKRNNTHIKAKCLPPQIISSISRFPARLIYFMNTQLMI